MAPAAAGSWFLPVAFGTGATWQQATGTDRPSWDDVETPFDVDRYDRSLGSPELVVGKSGTVLERDRIEAATQLGGEPLKDRKMRPSANAGVDADGPDTDGSDRNIPDHNDPDGDANDPLDATDALDQ